MNGTPLGLEMVEGELLRRWCEYATGAVRSIRHGPGHQHCPERPLHMCIKKYTDDLYMLVPVLERTALSLQSVLDKTATTFR